MLTAGGDRCVRFWSFDAMKPSRTVCGVEKSGVHDVYQRQGARYTCTEEKTTTKTAVGEEVKPIHTMAITGLCEVRGVRCRHGDCWRWQRGEGCYELHGWNDSYMELDCLCG